VHVTEEVLGPVRARYGEPRVLEWSGEVTAEELALATYNPARTHDLTLFVLDPHDRIALIRKPHFAPGIWRPPGGGAKPGEGIAAAAEREALEETGLRATVERYLVATDARFVHGDRALRWRTHVFLARTGDEAPAPHDTDEIAAARWGTLEELAGSLRERLLATGSAFWRYRVALHDAALAALAT
jgi:ADP-ribose pyrophosphatase YjhB (NUDIX family)